MSSSEQRESAQLHELVNASLPGFKRLFRALLTRGADHARDDGVSVSEAAFMKLLQPVSADYAPRSDVLEVYHNILQLERQAGSAARGLSLQGLIAASCKVALEVFSRAEWQPRFPRASDKLRLLFFLVDPGQASHELRPGDCV